MKKLNKVHYNLGKSIKSIHCHIEEYPTAIKINDPISRSAGTKVITVCQYTVLRKSHYTFCFCMPAGNIDFRFPNIHFPNIVFAQCCM